MQRLTEDLKKLQHSEDELKNSRCRLKIKDIESKISKIEENELQKLIEIGYNCELHTINLEKTREINELKSDIEELSYNISSDDRLSVLMEN